MVAKEELGAKEISLCHTTQKKVVFTTCSNLPHQVKFLTPYEQEFGRDERVMRFSYGEIR